MATKTVLGEFGSNLFRRAASALGDRAQALVMNPAILILDESTSGLDPLSEAKVLKNSF